MIGDSNLRSKVLKQINKILVGVLGYAGVLFTFLFMKSISKQFQRIRQGKVEIIL